MDRLLRNNQDGFTLTEMLVSLAIFSIGMLAVISLFTTSFSALRFVRNLSNANSVGQEMMEILSSPGVDAGGVTTGMSAIVNTIQNKPYAVLNSVSTTRIEAKWPDDTNPTGPFRYNLEVNKETGFPLGSGQSAIIANVIISWDEMGTTKKIYFESLFD